jgi:hypothetical protein
VTEVIGGKDDYRLVVDQKTDEESGDHRMRNQGIIGHVHMPDDPLIPHPLKIMRACVHARMRHRNCCTFLYPPSAHIDHRKVCSGQSMSNLDPGRPTTLGYPDIVYFRVCFCTVRRSKGYTCRLLVQSNQRCRCSSPVRNFWRATRVCGAGRARRRAGAAVVRRRTHETDRCFSWIR